MQHMQTQENNPSEGKMHVVKSTEENTAKADMKSSAVTADQLLNKDLTEMPALIENLIPKVGLASLAGSSDTGKSCKLRQLATSVALGHSTFLGFKINATHNKAIYVSTEDDENAIAYLLNKQKDKDVDEREYKNLRYIFNTDNLLNTLDQELTNEPADLVVIDTFTDIYTGELNAANKIRGFLNDFGQLAQKHKCSIIFLHHTGKRTDDLEPSKHNLLGSQGFEAKMRVVLELRKDKSNPDLRHLCIVKGNYLPQELKGSSFVLKFNENMTFTNTNERKSYDQLNTRIGSMEKDKQLIEDVYRLKDEGKSLAQITKSINKEKHRAGKTKIQGLLVKRSVDQISIDSERTNNVNDQ